LDEEIRHRKQNVATACAAALVAWVGLFSHLGAIGLVGPDEPRYAWIARAMAQSGDWVTPRLYGSPWFEKPILYYWMAAVGFELHLPAEWAARLPSALAALAAALSIAWLASGCEGVGRQQAHGPAQFRLTNPVILAPLLLSASVAAIGFARAATPDMLFAASITFAMAAASVVLRDSGGLRDSRNPSASGTPRNSAPALVGFGAFVGLAVLAKGPAAIILAGGAVGVWMLAVRRWRPAFGLLHPLALGSFSVVALPWYIVCAVRNPEFLHVFIFEHNFERYLTPIFQHPQPFWFFIPIILLAILPWTAFLIPAACDGLRLWRANRWRDSPAFFVACWAFFPILFFSFSESKLPGYILPAVPALALTLARAVSKTMQPRSARGWPIFAFLGLTWVGLAAGSWIWLRYLPFAAAVSCRAAVLAGSVIAAAGGIAILFCSALRRSAALWTALLVVSLLVELAGSVILPKLDPYYSARAVGTMLRADQRPDRLFVYDLPRAWQYGLAFYLDRQLGEWSPDDLDAALVLTTPRGAEDLKSRGFLLSGVAEPYHTVLLVPIPARPRGEYHR
jgi:4-amino-4-deoxy-L-arabinose transferase-like glycosyltransferase